LVVRFTYGNSASTIALQVSYTDSSDNTVTLDAKNCFCMNSNNKAMGAGDILPNSTVEFYYDEERDCFIAGELPNRIGVGTCATNATSSATSQPTLAVTLTNNGSVTSFPIGYTFKVTFTYAYGANFQPLMSVNGGTASPVTIGGVSAGAGCFSAGRSYTFTWTGSNFDCLSNCNLQDLQTAV